mgnify:CR=1 FL=1
MMSSTETGYAVTIDDTGESFYCGAEQTVLNAMVGLGRKGIPSGCHGGGCGICKIQVAAGDYTHLPMSVAHVSVHERLERFALACRVFPRSDLELKVVGQMRKAVVRYVS